MKGFYKMAAATLLALSAFSIANAFVVSDNPPTPKEIEIRKEKGKIKSPRDLWPEAVAFISGSTIFVELYDAGPSTIYILNSRNQVVAEESTEGQEYESAVLPLPEARGSYQIVIVATYLYGEGAFTIE